MDLQSSAAAGQSSSPHKHAKFLLALPVDGLDAARLHAFEHLCAPAQPRLVVTARRARALGIETAGPVALKLAEGTDADAIYSLVADADAG